jgi:hypothetical protein
MQQLELIGINANSDLSRERTRANFVFLDALNNHDMNHNLQFLAALNTPRVRDMIAVLSTSDIDQLKEDLVFLRDFARSRRTDVAGFRQGFVSSIGEWVGRILALAVGAVIAWFASGRR